MQNIIITSLFLIFSTQIIAQNNIGIGTNTPDSSAKLDIESTDKGVLIPRVALTHTDSTAPISSPETSLLVYNTDSVIITGADSMSSVYPGFYYWTGSEWTKMMDRKSDNTSSSSDFQAEYLYAEHAGETLNQNTYIGGFTATNSSGLNLSASKYVTLKAGVTYELEANVSLSFSGTSSANIDLRWRDTNGTFYGNYAQIYSEDANTTASNQSTAKAVVTPTTDIIIGIYCTWRSANTATRGDFGYMSVKAISGQLPVEIVNPLAYDFAESTDGVTTEISLTGTKIKGMSVVAPSDGIWNIYGEALIEYAAGSINWEIRKNGTSISNGGSNATFGDGYATSNDWRKVHINRKNISLQSGDLIEVFIWEADDGSALQGHMFKPFVNLEKVAGQLPVSTQISLAGDVNTTPHTQQTTIAKGATLRCFDGVNWEADVVEGFSNANTAAFTTPWGLVIDVGNGSGQQQAFIQNVSGSTKYCNTEATYATMNGYSADSYQAFTLTNNAYQRFWVDNSLTLGAKGDRETLRLMWANSDNDWAAGNYQEFLITSVIGSGYNNNYFRVQRIK